MYLLVDTSWLFTKYFFVNRDLQTKEGLKTGHFYGFLYFVELLYRNIRRYKKIIFVLDRDKKLYDKINEYTGYKKGRESKKELYKNFDDFLALLSIFPNSCIIRNVYAEADETIAYISLNYCNKNKVMIYSGDKDFIQLLGVSENISLSNTYKNGVFVKMTDEEIWNKFKNSKKENFTRISENKKDILKYRVFKGDTSDNISGAIKGLKDSYIKNIISVWEEDYLDQDVLANIIIKLDSKDLKFKLAENFDNVLLNYKLMDLTHLKNNSKLQKNTKKINVKADKELLKKLLSKYELGRYKDFLTREGLI